MFICQIISARQKRRKKKETKHKGAKNTARADNTGMYSF